VKLIEQFFRELDQDWKPSREKKLLLSVIGSGSLFLQTDYERETKDSDVLETVEISEDISRRLKNLAGRGSPIFKKYGIFLDIVRLAVPFLPQTPIFHEVPALNDLKNFSVQALDVVDVVVSKLKPFRARDLDDIRFLASQKLLPHGQLLKRFRDVVDYYAMDARSEDFSKYIENLNTIEEDIIRVPKSDIDLPSWI